MAKKRSPKKRNPKPDPGLLPMPVNAPPENTKINPLDPPPPQNGGGKTKDA